MNGLAISTEPTTDSRRDAIIRHARQQFMSVGYAATRIEPVARAANVSTATLYTYFTGKADLFTAVIDDASTDFMRQMQHVKSSSGSAREQLVLFTETYATFMGDPFVRSVFRLVMAERPRFRTVALRFFEVGRQNFGAALIAALETLCRSGELKIDRPSWAAGQLMGMIEHPVFFVPLVTGDEVKTRRSGPQIAADAVETFLSRYGTGD
jgi:AcrR family transcriptional regulator